jgi:hypothetical protein
MRAGRETTHIDGACILSIKPDDGLAARLDFNPILRAEPSHNLDAICVGHDGNPLPALPGSANS